MKEFWDYFTGLTLDTVRVYLRLFPQLMSLQLAGWAGYYAVLHIASVIAGRHAWVALAIFSTGFICLLTPIIVQLRLIGDYLRVREVLPDDHPVDDRDDGITRLLALTLLPFLGIYAAFNYIFDSAGQLVTSSLAQSGIFNPENNVVDRLAPGSPREMWQIAAIVAGAYTLRRLLDLLHEATDIRALGLLAALVEGFFMLSLLLSGGHILASFSDWLTQTALAAWWGTFVEGLSNSFALIKINLPGVLVTIASFFFETLWPFLTSVLARPVMWLAVASLVYGSHMLSVAEVWAKGERPSDAVAKLTRAQRRQRARAGSGNFRRAWLEFQEIFLGDIDDKYVPSFQSLRLVLRVGVLFLASFVLLYTLFEFGRELFNSMVLHLIGGQQVKFWTAWGPLTDIGRQLLEPLRISLLAVAFRQALLVLQAKADSRPDLQLTTDDGVKAS